MRYFVLWLAMTAGAMAGWLLMESVWPRTIPTSAPALGIHDALVNAVAFGLAIWAAKNLDRWFNR